MEGLPNPPGRDDQPIANQRPVEGRENEQIAVGAGLPNGGDQLPYRINEGIGLVEEPELPELLFGPTCPRRMRISDQDRQRAIRIRNAVAQTPELDALSDYWCVQFALVLGDDIESCLQRALRLQHYREEYGIIDSLEFGLQSMREFIRLLWDQQ